MRPESNAVDAAIDYGARLLVTPPADDGLLARVVARLPERPGHGYRRLWWIPVASAAAFALSLVLGPDVVSRVAPTPPAVLVAESWPTIASLAWSVTPALPPARASAAGPSRHRSGRPVVDEGAWGLSPVTGPTPLEIGGLSAVMGVPETIDVSPLAVEALRSPAALSEMKE